MSEWQPIETAPMDGTNILLRGLVVNLPKGLEMPTPVTITGYWDDVDAAFCATTSTFAGPFINATHWMPLPEPPK